MKKKIKLCKKNNLSKLGCQLFWPHSEKHDEKTIFLPLRFTTVMRIV